MSINTAEIPQIEGDLDVVDGAGAKLKSAGTGFSTTGSEVHSTWQGLSGVYRAPEVGELLAATAPVASDAAAVGTDVGSVGAALSAYAVEVRPIKAELARLRVEAVAFNTTIAGDEEWTKDEDKVNQKNNLLKSVNAAVAAWQQAERTCASAINATFGGVQYRADDGDGTTSPDEYGYAAGTLDGATAGDEGVPWGKASEVDKPWYEDAWNGVVSFGKGLVVDGLWGAVRGLGTMVGVDGFDAAKQAWLGIGKLALSLNPVAIAVDQTVGMPGMAKGELGATQLAAGKALIAYDMWGEDPARASGAVVGNVLGAVIGTKGAGAAIKGSGTVAKAGAAASRTFPKTAELAATIGGKVGDLKINVASTLNTKITSLGEKIALPKFGPQPALAGAGGRGGSTFEMTPGTRTGPQGAGVAARIDDGAPGASRPVDQSAGGAAAHGPTSDTPSGEPRATAADQPMDHPVGTDTSGTALADSSRASTSSPDAPPADGSKQPFTYGGRKTDPGSRGLLGDHLTVSRASLDGDTVLRGQVRVIDPATGKVSVADHLMENADGGVDVVETKTGDASLTANQKEIYPKVSRGGLRLGTDVSADLRKGDLLQPGTVDSVRLQRWAIDTMPADLRGVLGEIDVNDVLAGRAGEASRMQLTEWLGNVDSVQVTRITQNP